MYVCISSLLIKPELHSEIGAIDVNQRFLVIESNFCWFARDVTAAMLVVKNKSLSLLWELNSIFM